MYNVDIAQTLSRRLAGPSGGAWWRFSSYEIYEGWICPANGAKLQRYDPWSLFEDTRGDTGQAPGLVQPPYSDFMQLVQQLEFVPGKQRYPDKLSAASQRLILDWSKTYGPLGVLLSRWEAISFAKQPDEMHGWLQRSYSRGFGQTVEESVSTGDVEDRSPRVLLRGLNDLILSEELPSRTWGRFFPRVPYGQRDAFAYPEPYTDEFCGLYAERLSDFCNAAQLLAGAMLHLGRTAPSQNDDLREQALDTINMLRRPVSSILYYSPGEPARLNWVSPSLLASFAEMYVQDLLFGRPTLRCSFCGLAFVSGAYQALFCSVKCRLVGQKRRLRQQMRQAAELHRQGLSPSRIAAAVEQPLYTVKGWLAKMPKRGKKRGVRGD